MRVRRWISVAAVATVTAWLCGCEVEANGLADDVTTDSGADVTPPPNVEKTRVALASGAVVCKSPNFKVIATLGQGPANNTVVKSPSFQVVGGIVGATQKKP